ncbi:MAG: hypothetical protein IJD91_02315 [Clostridia bacterium]|nr:hypothetical protein [Clostridia bacterium]
MKKLAILFTLIILCFASNVCAKEAANIPACSVTLSGQNVDNSYRQYPLLQYRDIVYFPMTYYDCRFLGVATKWNADTNTLEITKENISGAYRNYNWEWKNGKLNEISICNFNIIVNGKEIDNKNEEYPLILFRDVTYFPLTWRFAVDEFGWEYSYDDKNGLVINADNYICKTLKLPDLRTQTVPNAATDGTYYYYTGNDRKIYRAPVDNPSANELILTTAPNGYAEYGNNLIGFSVQDSGTYLSFRTGNSMGTNYRYKINPDGSVEESEEGNYSQGFVGGNEYIYDLDGYTVKVFRGGGPGTSRVIYYKDGNENYSEILAENMIFAEKKHPSYDSWQGREGRDYNDIQIIGNNIYLTGYNTTDENNSSLYCYNLDTQTLTPLIENVTNFLAFTGWDNETKSNSEMIVYSRDGKMYRYSGASGKTIVINNNSLPLIRGVCYSDTLYLHTENEEKTVVEMYLGYGIGSAAGAHIFETTLPTDSQILDGRLVTHSYGETDGDKDIRTCVFLYGNTFRSSDNIRDIFIHNGIMLYRPFEENMIVEVDLNKTFYPN